MSVHFGKPLMVYLAGPYSGDVEAHIASARRVAVRVAALGHLPVTPHLNTPVGFEELQPYEFWIAAYLKLLGRCDAILMLPGWERSNGARQERQHAMAIGLPEVTERMLQTTNEDEEGEP